MDVRGTAPVYIPPAYPMNMQETTQKPPPLSAFSKSPSVSVHERRVGQKIKIAFVLTLFFIGLQLHPVMAFLDRTYGMVFMSPFELANEYGCPTMKGILFVSILFFILVLLWIRSL
jgi:hypothetical protein